MRCVVKCLTRFRRLSVQKGSWLRKRGTGGGGFGGFVSDEEKEKKKKYVSSSFNPTVPINIDMFICGAYCIANLRVHSRAGSDVTKDTSAKG
jgi:hypothetical protein